MKSLSIKKRELVDAIAYQHHVDFDPEAWTWQVTFSPKAQQPEAHVVFVDLGETTSAPFFVGEQPYPVRAFTKLDGDFHWGEPGTMDPGQPDDGKGLEAICIPDAIRCRVEDSLRKQVTLDNNTFSVRYY